MATVQQICSTLPHLKALAGGYLYQDADLEFGDSSTAIDAYVRSNPNHHIKAALREVEKVLDLFERGEVTRDDAQLLLLCLGADFIPPRDEIHEWFLALHTRLQEA